MPGNRPERAASNACAAAQWTNRVGRLRPTALDRNKLATEKIDFDTTLRDTLRAVAPGTPLRDGLERVLRGRTGGLFVLGQDRTVDSITTGGFTVDVEFTSTRLRELSKMDGALVLDRDATRIIHAAVQLVPDPSIPTDETGTRHRTADRVARQTGFPVISVSKSMNIIAVYVGGRRYVLEDSAAILSRANQALATLERYKSRLDEVSGTLSALEVEDVVTVRDVVTVVQRLEMVRRIAGEVRSYVVELGTDGRLLSLQLEELVAGVDTDRALIVRDYLPQSARRNRKPETSLAELDALSATDLLEPLSLAKAIGFAGTSDLLDHSVSPHGFRLLARVPRLPEVVVERLVEHFGTLGKLLSAGIEDLRAVEGVGDSRARTVRDGLSRLAESSILERYV